jgi:hypothetical protein
MSVFVWLIGLPVPVLLALVIAGFLFLCFRLVLVALDPTASERIARFVDELLLPRCSHPRVPAEGEGSCRMQSPSPSRLARLRQRICLLVLICSKELFTGMVRRPGLTFLKKMQCFLQQACCLLLC